MWRVWDVVRNVHGGASPDRVKAECAALSRVITKTQMSRQGFTFPDLWKAWLRNYLFGLWNEERPKNVKGNRPAKFEDVERAVIIGAAEFWCQYLEDFEPDNMRGQNERVEAALRAALKL